MPMAKIQVSLWPLTEPYSGLLAILDLHELQLKSCWCCLQEWKVLPWAAWWYEVGWGMLDSQEEKHFSWYVLWSTGTKGQVEGLCAAAALVWDGGGWVGPLVSAVAIPADRLTSCCRHMWVPPQFHCWQIGPTATWQVWVGDGLPHQIC